MIKLKRYEKNPILEPKKENKWESEAVFNCAAIRDAGLFHLIYRAMGEDNISRLGYAVSKDGFNFNFFRLDKPVFQPENESERLGIALLDKNDPSCVLRRQKEPILEPEKEYEQKGKRDNVVFSCGACEMDKLFYVYYGAADNVIGVATMDKSFWR